MSKAAPWNISGVGVDARDAAREAARRQGKSLGEWLHGVIADHASDRGIEPNDVEDAERVAAVTERLERLSQRSATFQARHHARDERDPLERRRPWRRDDEDRAAPLRLPRRDPKMIEETEFLLEEAIDAMERRAARAERHTEDAIASFAKLLESAETKRAGERDAVLALTEKLSDIETKLVAHQDDAQQSPVKGALARLEARLETIGRRTIAETTVHDRSLVAPSQSLVDNEPMRRLEDKLNSILDAVAKAEPEPTPSSRPVGERRLGEAIAEISRRQRALDHDLHAGDDIAPRRTRPILVRELPQDEPWQYALSAMQAEIVGLAAKIEDIHHSFAARPPVAEPAGLDLDRLHAEIATMSRRIGEIAERGHIADASHQSRDDAQAALAVHQLRGQIETVAAKVDGLVESHAPSFARIQGQMQEIRELLSTTAIRPVGAEDATISTASPVHPAANQVDTLQLERLVRDLAEKIEATQAPGADADALESLQAQMELLARKFEKSEAGLASLGSLEHSMQDLFRHLEQTQEKIQVSAAAAAREALRAAADEAKPTAPILDSTALKALQSEADARTQKTLVAVHETLEHVVGRMSAMEADIGRMRRVTPEKAPAPAPVTDPVKPELTKPAPAKSAPAKPAPAKSAPAPRPVSLAAAAKDRIDPRLEAALGAPITTATPRPQAQGARPKLPKIEDETGRADYIAAARRAAQAAQADSSVAALKNPAPADDARTSLLEKSRNYVATHKRPVLLSVAAVFVVLGTMAIVHRMTFGDDAQVAALKAPAPVRQLAAMPAASLDEMSPSALPRKTKALAAQIPGSDPIPTASIQSPRANAAPSLPTFASPAPSAPRPTIPTALTNLAEEGDTAAAYELATRYADGKLGARDFKLAARWYQKAADKGLAPAQYRLAALYEKGLGVAQDKDRARGLYRQAAEAGNPRAMHNLAVLLADGDGKPDYVGAAALFRKAAQYGVHDSQYNLAILLARGLGVEPSLVQSYQWFAIAAAHNDADAAKKRDEVGDKLSANDLAVAKALAASFQEKVANMAAVEVASPPGGWDSLEPSSHLNSARSKISSL